MCCLQLVSVCEREREGGRERREGQGKRVKRRGNRQKEKAREREGLTVDHVIVLSENF